MRSALPGGFALFALLLAACGDGTTRPQTRDATIAVQGGDNQVWSPGLPVPKPLQVVVKNSATNLPLKGVLVTWRVTEGAGASVQPASTLTDSTGIAEARLTLGPAPGMYKVSATFTGNIGPQAKFSAEAVTGATITSVVPASVRGGDTVTVTGEGFSQTPQNNTVVFAGVRGAIVSGTATQLRVIVPLCVPAGTIPVSVVVGANGSPPVNITVADAGVTTLPLNVGQVQLLSDPAAINCVRLASNASYLLVVENATDVADSPFAFRLLGLGGTSAIASTPFPGVSVAAAMASTGGVAEEFELLLRQQEAKLVRQAGAAAGVAGGLAPRATLAAVPGVGDSANFFVLNDINATSTTFTTVKAKVQVVTPHAIIFQDVNMPAGSAFTTSDYQQFGTLFDDPIYATDTGVFGQPSDVDANAHIIILFTPVVNGLSAKGSTSFVAGFFYGCDLLTGCTKSNKAEIFYGAVPDPNGTVGPTLSKDRIMQTTPAVLAHEFMHMIHFNQRILLRHPDSGDEALWLSEALAHTAEDTVGGVFLARGDSTRAVQFMAENWARANQYLPVTASTSLLALSPPGTLPERGAGWLFLKYLRGRFGGGIITALTQACPDIPCPSAPSSAENVTAQTHTSWSSLINDWSVALWASGQPDLAGAPLDPRYTFVGFNIRRILGQPAFGGVYLLQPADLPFGSFSPTGTVVSSASAYYKLSGPPGAAPLTISLSGPRGVPFGSDVVPQLAILRYK